MPMVLDANLVIENIGLKKYVNFYFKHIYLTEMAIRTETCIYFLIIKRENVHMNYKNHLLF